MAAMIVAVVVISVVAIMPIDRKVFFDRSSRQRVAVLAISNQGLTAKAMTPYRQAVYIWAEPCVRLRAGAKNQANPR
jgi:hypothetical protein